MSALGQGAIRLQKLVAVKKNGDDVEVVRLIEQSLTALTVELDDIKSTSSQARPMNMSRKFLLADIAYNKATLLAVANLYRIHDPLIRLSASLSSLDTIPDPIRHFALTQGATREMVNSSVDDFALKLRLKEPPPLTIAGIQVAIEPWVENVLRDFAKLCLKPNVFEVNMLAQALAKEEAVIEEWFSRYQREHGRLYVARRRALITSPFARAYWLGREMKKATISSSKEDWPEEMKTFV
ncbi:hypothetical protein K461DRAFT_269917 [Myriangium duriaei CBS 260.36]|uniref:Uncharacterized protein n=1 Tax=Myriangium duriaei CBS 260.36 TaxID=1168546 RepID=A0A9P4J155_9PEZI|nr:hypothetical protein K461DRAFT_269917 [Myriangium duriaei CBS 260.36]